MNRFVLTITLPCSDIPPALSDQLAMPEVAFWEKTTIQRQRAVRIAASFTTLGDMAAYLTALLKNIQPSM